MSPRTGGMSEGLSGWRWPERTREGEPVGVASGRAERWRVTKEIVILTLTVLWCGLAVEFRKKR